MTVQFVMSRIMAKYDQDFAARRVATVSHGKEGADMSIAQKATEFDQEMTIDGRSTSHAFLSQTIIIEVISERCMIDVI
jgi:hypothetical protein